MILSLEKSTTSAQAKFPKKRKTGTKLDPAKADIHLGDDLMDLVRLRVVQILGCKRCMREYSDILKGKGETDQRLRLLERWRRESAFTPREKAALNLAEAVTGNPFTSIPREAIYPARIFFTEEQMIFFVLDIVAIHDRHYLKSFQHDMTRRPPHE
jgi:alkylhydroperoxidase family enzyme